MLEMMKLNDLIKDSDTDIALPHVDADVRAICYDSRKAAPGSLFVCVRGVLADGHAYARSAYERGCRCFVCETLPDDLPDDAIVLFSSDTRRSLTMLSAAFYGHPERRMKLIGITGTKGKTTTAAMLQSILTAAGFKVGVIGTLGAQIGGET